jgi:hypothetical protein
MYGTGRELRANPVRLLSAIIPYRLVKTEDPPNAPIAPIDKQSVLQRSPFQLGIVNARQILSSPFRKNRGIYLGFRLEVFSTVVAMLRAVDEFTHRLSREPTAMSNGIS